MILVGPTKEHVSNSAYIKEEGENLATLDSFSAAKAEVRELESRVIPQVVTSLTCAFGSAENWPRFAFIDRTIFAKTSSGAVLHDIRIQMDAELTVSRKLPISDLEKNVGQISTLVTKLNPKVSRFLNLALEEKDLLKRFLYFFLAIEIETHAQFKNIDHSGHLARLINSQARVQESSTNFFDMQRTRWKTLTDRFIWCALTVWAHVTDDDIDQFKKLKGIRDEIAHGSISEPSAESVKSAERLALKLQLLNV